MRLGLLDRGKLFLIEVHVEVKIEITVVVKEVVVSPPGMSMSVGPAGEEELEDEEGAESEEGGEGGMCPPGRHRWVREHCLVCTVCHECTGYGAACVSSGRPNRNSGQ